WTSIMATGCQASRRLLTSAFGESSIRRQLGRPGRTPSIRPVASRQAMQGSFGEPITGGTKADVAKQVKNFLDYAEPDQSTLVALDFQRTGANTMTLDQAREFLSRIEEELRRKAVIYSGELIKTRLGRQKDPFFGAHRLWLAHYNVHPVVQRSWDKYWLWQYTDNTKGIKPNRVPGIPGDSKGNLDCNSYDGTRAQLNDEWAS